MILTNFQPDPRIVPSLGHQQFAFASEQCDSRAPKREVNQLNQPLDFRSEVQKGQSNPENCQDGNPESCDRESLL